MNYKEIEPDELQEIISDQSNAGYVLLDVRTPEENKAERIPDSVLINFYEPDFKEKVSSLEKDKTYYVICRSGNRSGKACQMMSEMGFKDCYNLVGGMLAWQGDVE
jgi:rhodanese-related sulfurtransferase